MKFFEVFVRRADFCGNVDHTHYCYVRAAEQWEVEAKYRHAPIIGFTVEEIDVLDLPAEPQIVPRHFR